ncbi:MAG TPA: EAL domain-containing protein [Longimicrobiaceae bacterium]|nr:EAL domain-containing protein [Longimicrobiaceae bacterium]
MPHATPSRPDPTDAVDPLADEPPHQLLVEGASDLMYRTDLHGRFTYVNPAVVQTTGFAAERLLGMHFSTLVHPDHRRRLVRFHAHQLRRGIEHTYYEFPILTRAGREVWLGQNLQLVRDGDEVVGAQAVARDITLHRDAARTLRENEASLARSEQYFRSLTENAHDLIHVVNLDGTTRYLSPSARRVLGSDPEELIGRDARELIHADDLPGLAAQLRELRGTTLSRTVELRVRHRDGAWRVFEAVVRNLAEDPVVNGVIINSRDITERKRAEEENLRLAALSRENPNPVLECDADGRPVHVNPAAESISRELGMSSVRGILPEDHAQRVHAALQTGQGFQHVEVSVSDRVFSWTYRPHLPARVVHLFAVDITSRRVMEEQLRHDALHDALTGLPNRLLFMERLTHVVARARRHDHYVFGVLFLDLDRFKVINDSLGHHVGDELLVVISQRLKDCLRTEDTVARLGGDEFAILLEDIGGMDDATRVAERIQAELSAPVNLSGFEVFTSASIGIALSTSATDRPEHLLRNADMAMYRAKSSGQARYEVFDREMHASALVRLQMETDLRRALDRGEFRLHYQPIVDLASGRLCAVEALLRWMHPDRGWTEPKDFVPVAEETGMILPIGQWVLREACERVRDWQRRFGARAPESVAVNLSAKQFSQADLVEQIEQVLARSELPASALRLEITESAVVDNADAAVVLLERLKRVGADLSLDDFGTGYSSLSYLHRFPLDALKIDRSFIGRMHEDERSAHLVQTVLALARSLGVSAVAEGVEIPEQLALLRALGCRYGQGYLFAEPLDPVEMEARMAAAEVWVDG